MRILVHPETGNGYRDHAIYPLWLGEPVPLRFEVAARRALSTRDSGGVPRRAARNREARRPGSPAMQLYPLLLVALALSGCGVAAAPCRVGSAGLKAVPLVGHVAAAPTDACADVIDPDSVSGS